MSYKPKILIIILIISYVCVVDGQDVIKTFNLSKLSTPTIVRLSDLGFAEIDYIPLETKEQSLISKIDLV
ncbi:MAG TPA: hypothetical protein PLL51_07040, partial [Bacteroidales bacterium]|nr:hypothetical protein [Bacteroidales bacterium]